MTAHDSLFPPAVRPWPPSDPPLPAAVPYPRSGSDSWIVLEAFRSAGESGLSPVDACRRVKLPRSSALARVAGLRAGGFLRPVGDHDRLVLVTERERGGR